MKKRILFIVFVLGLCLFFAGAASVYYVNRIIKISKDDHLTLRLGVAIRFDGKSFRELNPEGFRRLQFDVAQEDEVYSWNVITFHDLSKGGIITSAAGLILIGASVGYRVFR